MCLMTLLSGFTPLEKPFLLNLPEKERFLYYLLPNTIEKETQLTSQLSPQL